MIFLFTGSDVMSDQSALHNIICINLQLLLLAFQFQSFAVKKKYIKGQVSVGKRNFTPLNRNFSKIFPKATCKIINHFCFNNHQRLGFSFLVYDMQMNSRKHVQLAPLALALQMTNAEEIFALTYFRADT